MQIAKIWISQRNLRRAGQIPEMVEAIHNGDYLPPITLARCEDDEIQVDDGHHRLTAMYLSGKKVLEDHEYLLVEKDQWKPRTGKITDLLRQRKMLNEEELFGSIDEAQRILDAPIGWQAKFTRIFDMRIGAKIKESGEPFEWHDPDGSHEDDARAYVDALVEWREKRKTREDTTETSDLVANVVC